MRGEGGVARQVPVALRGVIDPAALIRNDPCDAIYALGSFWPYFPMDPESRIVKTFKKCVPVTHYQPYITRLCAFYADIIVSRLEGHRPKWVTRVLSSAEERCDPSRPQSLLLRLVCERTGAFEADVFYRSSSRPPMRVIKTLSGHETTIRRARYALQDLFLRPTRLAGSVLLIDDIMNTGASMRIYAQALKDYCEAESVIGINLAVTRFGESDGWDRARLDLSAYPNTEGLRLVWVDHDGTYHAKRECNYREPNARCELAFTLDKQAGPCSECAKPQRAARRFWFNWP